MTWTEVYNRVVFKIWGNSTVPAGTLAVLQGDEGIIGNVHRKIQQDYNYWFMQTSGTLTSASGTQSYSATGLSGTYKEIISMAWLVDGETFYSDPLSPVSTQDAEKLYIQSAATAKYPTLYELRDENIILYPIPTTSSLTLRVQYWQFLDRPPASFDATTDDLITYGADAVVNGAAAEMLEILKEWDSVKAMNGRAGEALELLKQEDRRRRQAPLYNIKYKDY